MNCKCLLWKGTVLSVLHGMFCTYSYRGENLGLEKLSTYSCHVSSTLRSWDSNLQTQGHCNSSVHTWWRWDLEPASLIPEPVLLLALSLSISLPKLLIPQNTYTHTFVQIFISNYSIPTNLLVWVLFSPKSPALYSQC